MTRRRVFTLLLLAAPVVFWFTAVDWCVIHHKCPNCHRFRDVLSYRVCGLPICQRQLHYNSTVYELIAVDLGVPCPHRSETHFRPYRALGLCIRVDSFSGILEIWDPPWYPPCARSVIISLRQSDPNLPAEYTQRVLVEHDREFFQGIIAKMRASCPPDQLPEATRVR